MDTPFFDAEATAKLDAAASACDALTSRLDAMERADAEDRISARVDNYVAPIELPTKV